eukprot:TRINITY_DN12945_c0_g1_i1.p1 TRINITY_DN12945_c0_g1~~TRINITY_DN12945_c0_g1_i1.p1  ORF type:complete len:256 (+),score=45.71 TRINITY_DN12945_c0_g1_i1:36-803(+)
MACQGAACQCQQVVEEISAVQQESVKSETVIVPGCGAQQCCLANKDMIAGQRSQASPPLSTLNEPTSPQIQVSSSITTPPGALGCNRGPSPLFRALRHGSLKEVKSALEHDPDAAIFPFLEGRFEVPLCYSVKFGRSEEIVQLLLQHAASVDAENADGKTPLMLLSSQPSNFPPSFFGLQEDSGCSKRQWSLNVAKLLIDAAADPMSSDRGMPSCIRLASQAGNSHLVRLYRGETDVDAHADNGEQRAFPQFVHW